MIYILEFSKSPKSELLKKIEAEFTVGNKNLTYIANSKTIPITKVTNNVLLITIDNLDDINKLVAMSEIIISAKHWLYKTYPGIEVYNGYRE